MQALAFTYPSPLSLSLSLSLSAFTFCQPDIYTHRHRYLGRQKLCAADGGRASIAEGSPSYSTSGAGADDGGRDC